MASERDIKLRIRSVRNIQQITKAMKMVAAARIRKVETQMKASRPYARKLKEVVEEMTAQMEGAVHPLMTVRPIQKVGVLIVSSDKGLCGSYNTNLLRMAQAYLAGLPGGKLGKLLLIGGKGNQFCQRRKIHGDKVFTGWSPSLDLAQELADLCTEWYLSGEVDEVRVFYTRAASAMVQVATEERILPLTGEEAEGRGQTLPYEFEPSAEGALNLILPRYLRVVLYQILLESRTSELGARLRAMSNATDNADKLASELTLDFYRIRQSNITNEILEISSGAEALKG